MQAFLFDFDGVIVDSEYHWQQIGDGVFYPSVVPGWTSDDGEKLMGLGAKAVHTLLTKDYGLRMDFGEFERKRHEGVDPIYETLAQPLPGLNGLLDRLTRMNVPLAVASSSHRKWIDMTLERLHLATFFPVITSNEDVGERTKPHPDLFLLAAEKLGIDPAGCVVLEDSTNGIRAAKAAGMTCIAILTPMNDGQDTSGADLSVKHYDELTEEVLKKL